MKFEKSLLTLMGSILCMSLSVSVVAAEKLQNMDAIWNSVGVAPTKHQNKQVNTRKAPPTKTQNTKLVRQRAAWKAKWDAQQRAKTLAQGKQRVAHKKPQQIARNKVVAAPKRIANKAPQQLTRAQYQWRWKQAQLKKKQQQAPQLVKHAPEKQTHATFRPSKQPAIANRLPWDIVKTLRSKGIKEHGMSAFVQDVNSPRPLLAYQDKTSRVPASVMKLITSYAALGTLGPNYRWPLDVLTTGSVKNGTLQGDLIIKGYGSPEFDTAALRKVLRGIRQKGIRNVKGRVVFDNTYFKTLSPHSGSFDGNKYAAYNAKPDALLFNERLSVFNLRASGKRVKITPLTPTHNLKIVNRMKRAKRSCRPKMSVSKRGQQTVVTFSGYLARRCGTRSFARVISEPANMIYGSMRSMWKREVGGQLNARFAMGRAPANARLLLRTHSRTLAQILPAIDKDSNNVMARQLLLTIGAKKSGGQGTERNGANAISTWLASRGLHFPELRIENGSGLSRHARISARHVGDLLTDAYRSPYRNYLMQSLAVAGVDGTMKRRLKGTRVRGRGFFKTGTLRNVRSIAGYVKAANGRTYVMAILHNDNKARRRSLKAHDDLIKWVYNGGGRQRLAMR